MSHLMCIHACEWLPGGCNSGKSTKRVSVLADLLNTAPSYALKGSTQQSAAPWVTNCVIPGAGHTNFESGTICTICKTCKQYVKSCKTYSICKISKICGSRKSCKSCQTCGFCKICRKLRNLQKICGGCRICGSCKIRGICTIHTMYKICKESV